MPFCNPRGQRLPSLRRPRAPRAFTMVEMVVLLAVGALIVGLLIPAVGASRERARALDCASRAQQLGIAINLYLADFPGCLPQVIRENEDGTRWVSPMLFGGKAGAIPVDGVDRHGVRDRPLNRYISPGTGAEPAGVGEIDAFRSPADRGAVLPDHGRVRSMYDTVGSSYVLNARRLRASRAETPVGTLIPIEGGPMPKLTSPGRTWMLGTWPILNFDTGADRRMIWYGRSRVRANLLMADMHIAEGSPVDVAPGAVQTTSVYTFLP